MIMLPDDGSRYFYTVGTYTNTRMHGVTSYTSLHPRHNTPKF